MTDSKTHRCPECPLAAAHTESEMCPSCGRCKLHCHGAEQLSLLAGPGDHLKMRPIGAQK